MWLRYAPIILIVLLNESEGIGTGWSSFVPNYNPRDIVANIKHMLNDEPFEPMVPWYKNFKVMILSIILFRDLLVIFKSSFDSITIFIYLVYFQGTIKQTSSKDNIVSYTISGIAEEINEVPLRIKEMPICKWTQDYKEFLEALMTRNDKIKDPFIWVGCSYISKWFTPKNSLVF